MSNAGTVCVLAPSFAATQWVNTLLPALPAQESSLLRQVRHTNIVNFVGVNVSGGVGHE